MKRHCENCGQRFWLAEYLRRTGYQLPTNTPACPSCHAPVGVTPLYEGFLCALWTLAFTLVASALGVVGLAAAPSADVSDALAVPAVGVGLAFVFVLGGVVGSVSLRPTRPSAVIPSAETSRAGEAAADAVESGQEGSKPPHP